MSSRDAAAARQQLLGAGSGCVRCVWRFRCVLGCPLQSWDARGGLEMPVAGIYQMEKLGISHQVAKNSPCFVYFALFFTSLGPFSTGYTLGFCPLQKCKVLGG